MNVTQKSIDKLYQWLKKRLPESYDKIDIEAYYDSRISLSENKEEFSRRFMLSEDLLSQYRQDKAERAYNGPEKVKRLLDPKRDIYNIDISKSEARPHKPYKSLKPCCGLDTETEQGKMFVLGRYAAEGYKEFSSDDPIKILEYLGDKNYFEKRHNFFFNIDYDFNAILKCFPMKNIKEVAKTNETIYEGYELKYIPNKMFSVNLGDRWHFTKFYDLMQFYNHSSLDKAGEKFLGIRKQSLKDAGIDVSQLSAEKFYNDSQYKSVISSYLERDCEITYKLSNKLVEMIVPYFKPKAFYSQATFSQQYFLEQLDYTLKLPNKKILDYALRAYQGGRFEVFRRGHMQHTWHYDIKSAYPAVNVKVPETNHGIWKETQEYQEGSLLGLYRCNIDISETLISPAKYQKKNHLMIYPIGKMENVYLNQAEYDCISQENEVKVLDGWVYEDNDPVYPYTFLKDFYDLKEKLKKEGKDELAMIPKIIINGFYGKQIQVIEQGVWKDFEDEAKSYIDVDEKDGKLWYKYRSYKAGKIFNPIVANEITANTRVLLYESVKAHHKDIIGFQTDSIISSRPLDLDFSNRLGAWEEEKSDKEMIILGSGVYQILDDLKPKQRMRGFHSKQDLKGMLQQGEMGVMSLKKQGLKSTMKAKLNDQEQYALYNQLIMTRKDIGLNFDHKRRWDRDFQDGKDVLENEIYSQCIVV